MYLHSLLFWVGLRSSVWHTYETQCALKMCCGIRITSCWRPDGCRSHKRAGDLQHIHLELPCSPSVMQTAERNEMRETYFLVSLLSQEWVACLGPRPNNDLIEHSSLRKSNSDIRTELAHFSCNEQWTWSCNHLTPTFCLKHGPRQVLGNQMIENLTGLDFWRS